MVFAYHAKEAKEVGFRTHIIRGEDGALAFGLRKYGKLRFMRNNKVQAVTCYGTLSEPLLAGFAKRTKQAFSNISHIFIKAKEYIDTDDNIIDSNKR